MNSHQGRPRGTFHQFLRQRLGGQISESLLPRRLRVYGHVAILWLNPQILAQKEVVGRAVLEYDSRIRSVLRRTNAISGPFRRPAMEVIAGSYKTETSFCENGCSFHLDPMKVMFSLGNKAERERMSRLGSDEVVVDMFAGIGQFTIPMAVHATPRVIHAIEWNPDAFHYLQRNIYANRVEEIVTPHQGDAATITNYVAGSQADRVLMGLVQGTAKYLNQGISCLRPGGILHFHEIYRRPNATSLAAKQVEYAAHQLDRQVRILDARVIKSFNSQSDHVVLDVQID